MLHKQVVAIDGVPQSNDQQLRFEYVRVGNTQNMVVSLRSDRKGSVFSLRVTGPGNSPSG